MSAPAAVVMPRSPRWPIWLPIIAPAAAPTIVPAPGA